MQNNLRGHRHREIAHEMKFQHYKRINKKYFDYFATLIQKM